MDRPTTGPEIVIGALQALGKASPTQIEAWFKETYGPEMPVTDSTLRQTVTRLSRKRVIADIPEEHGMYRMPTDADRSRWREEDRKKARAEEAGPLPGGGPGKFPHVEPGLYPASVLGPVIAWLDLANGSRLTFHVTQVMHGPAMKLADFGGPSTDASSGDGAPPNQEPGAQAA